jgi:prephenate dehydratase
MAKKKRSKSPKKSSIWVRLGRKGGKARAARLSAFERHRIAMMGVEARRAKRNAKTQPSGAAL